MTLARTTSAYGAVRSRAMCLSSAYPFAVSVILCVGLGPRDIDSPFPLCALDPMYQTGLHDPKKTRNEFPVRCTKQAGAVLNFGEAVLECTSSSRGTGVRTSKQTYKADQLVVCAGAWAPRLLPELAMQIQVLRKVMVWFDPIADAEDFLPGRYPYWIWEEDGTIGYGHPAVDGVYGGVKVGIHSGGILTDPDRVDRFVRAEDVDEIRNFITGRIPNLNGQYVRSAVCHYDNTPDRNFIIGPVPGDEKVIVAAGTSGHAFKFVPAIAEVISDLVTTGNSREDIALFESGRFSNTGRRT